MGFDDAHIILDNAAHGNDGFYPGQTVEGKIVFRQDKVKTFRGFFVKLKGACKVHWTTRSNKRTKHHRSHEEYVNEQVYFMGGPDGEVELQPGDHVFPFVLHIPAHCPPSYESDYGKIRYKLKFVIDRPFKFDQEKELPIQVLSRRDLNADPQCKEPIEMHFEKNFSCCCISFGSCDGQVTVPVTGYCPGQTLRCEAEFNNDSSVLIDFVEFKIVERKIYRANNTGSTRKEKTVHAKIEKGARDGIPAHSARTWTVEMYIPPMEVYNMDACSYIDIYYDFKVTISPSGCQSNESSWRRIVLGHIPLLDSEVDTTAQANIAKTMAHHPIQTQPYQPYPSAYQPYPSANLPYPSANNPSYPSANPIYPGANPPYPSANPPNPSANPPYPSANPIYPGANPPYPSANSPYPGVKMPESAVQNMDEDVPFLPRSVPYVPPTPMSPFGKASAPEPSTPDTETES